MAEATRVCSFDGCDRPWFTKGLCNGHDAQQRRGVELTPLRPRPPRGTPLAERLEFYSTRDGECLLWSGAIDRNGYGILNLNGRAQRVHRLSYTESVGPIEDRLEINHLCGVRSCLEPTHLEPVTAHGNGIYRTVLNSNNTSGFPGVTRAWDRWVAQVRHQGENVKLGSFGTWEEAVACSLGARRVLGYTIPSKDGFEVFGEQASTSNWH